MRRKENDKVVFCLQLCTPFHPEAIYLSQTHANIQRDLQKKRESCLKLSIISWLSQKEFNWKIDF